jgi:hypothetical protein
VNEFQSCAVCGRTILRGERAADYVDDDGERALVCPLCKPRAEQADWVPAEKAGTVSRHQGGRRRVGAGLRERLTRATEAAGARFARRAESDGTVAAEAPPPPRRISPLERFNASPEARKVAGLARSLGAPKVAVRDRAGAKLITVAWELSWYQWEVHGETVRQIATGREIEELAEHDREWNAVVGEDGSVRVG